MNAPHRRTTSKLAAALAVVSLAAAGCSLTISGPDARRPAGAEPRCDTGKGPIFLDVVGALVAGSMTVLAATSDVPRVAWVPGPIAGLFIVTSLIGNSRANACRAARAEFRQQQKPVPPAAAEPAER